MSMGLRPILIPDMKEIEQAASAALASVNIKLLECTPLADKKAGGVGTGKVRLAFDCGEEFDFLSIHRVKTVRLPSMAFMTLRPSAEFCAFYNIHPICLKTRDRRSAPHLICTCASGLGAGPSMSRASVQGAQDQYRARALKRAREEKDPFA